MTIINQLTNIEEIERYQKNFREIAEYLRYKAGALGDDDQRYLRYCANEAAIIWRDILPVWAQQLLEMEI